ncbi:hypothetical protein RND71_023436 [Anisodus tanguticus]|uniref:Uncharacterized protein n=1 Tax=Anisodus tanguticus TaxID=243964 RepID=A0AAE1RTW2_9SOLA|nr:hypothetical protein RND71_023436 [Anisodus tanguticus]
MAPKPENIGTELMAAPTNSPNSSEKYHKPCLAFPVQIKPQQSFSQRAFLQSLAIEVVASCMNDVLYREPRFGSDPE